MEVKTVLQPITESDADALLIYMMETREEGYPRFATRAVNDALDGMITELFHTGEFLGELGDVDVIHTRGMIPASRVIVVGLGHVENFSMDVARRAVATGMKKAREQRIRRVATVALGTGRGGLTYPQSAQAVVEGALLGLYRYRGQKTDPAPEQLPVTLELAVYDEEDFDDAVKGVQAGLAFVDGAVLARTLVNLPPNICTPDYLGDAAKQVGEETGLKVEVLTKSQIEALKMGGLLAVAKGSETPPRFVIMEHNAARADSLDTVVLVGKGVTFDTGGYNIKGGSNMGMMKGDMGGGAAVIGAMKTIAQLDVPLHVVGLVPTADNRVSGSAYVPQDVITASNGITIEITNTDAEGRLMLADALVFAKRYNPTAVVDIATLTGSKVVALGSVYGGLFCEDGPLTQALVEAGLRSNERLWTLPMDAEYEKALESLTADTKNSAGREGGASIAAMFLRKFTDYPAWAHIDMAGAVFSDEDNGYLPKGATGYGVRLLAEFLRVWSARGEE